jgi:hypothetical protein
MKKELWIYVFALLILIPFIVRFGVWICRRRRDSNPTEGLGKLCNWLLRGEIKRTESLEKFGPQLPLLSSPSENATSKFKESTGVIALAVEEPVAGCFFDVQRLQDFLDPSTRRKATNIMEGTIGSIDFVTFDYTYTIGGAEDYSIQGTAMLFKSDQLNLPYFKWEPRLFGKVMKFQPQKPLIAKDEVGRKQCMTCGNWGVRWAMIEDGGMGDYCPHCKKSFYKMNEEKVLKLSKVMSYANYPMWSALGSNTQLLLYRGGLEFVAAEKYQEFMEEALMIFQLFQASSQSLKEDI